MKKSFHIGDKIVAHWSDGDYLIATRGTIINFLKNGLLQMTVTNDGADGSYFAPGTKAEWHPKQCRKLAKPKTVWLRLNYDGSVYDSTIKEPGKDLQPPWTEFREVNKKIKIT